jgi:serine/threonine-protein kinase
MSTRAEKELIADFLIGESLIQPQLNRIVHGDETLQIEPKIMRVLVCLAERHGQVVTREELMSSVWGDVFVSEQVLSRSISELRKVLADDSKNIIETIPKTGYRLVAPLSFDTDRETERATTIEFPRAVIARPERRWATPGLIISLAACVLLAVAALWGWMRSPSMTPASVMRLTLDLSETMPAELDLFQSFALSPDGSRIAYTAKSEGRYQLFLRVLDQAESVPLTGTEGGAGPFFSPDGQWIGFYAGGVLKKVSTGGGAPLIIGGPADDAVGANWGEDGSIIYSRRFFEGLYRIPAGGGKGEPLTLLDSSKGERSHFWPEILPGGKVALFTNWHGSGTEESQIDALVLATGERRTLIKGGSRARYLPTGHLVYARKGALRITPFDIEKLEVTGQSAPVPERLATNLISGAAHYDFSRDGLLVYLPERARKENSRFLWVDGEGREQALIEKPQTYWTPRLSPDGKRLAVAIQNENFDIWTYEIANGAFKRLTFERGNLAPVWTPDGKRIVFSSDTGGPPLNLYWKAADGSDAAERLTQSSNLQFAGSWSPDSRLLAFSEIDPATRWDIWLFDIEERKARPLFRSGSNETHPMFSPDGRWLAYTSDETGQQQVYVISFPDGAGKWQISTEGGSEPLWSKDGRKLFYRAGERVMSVVIDEGGGFKASKPQMVFEGKYKIETIALLPSYDLAANGDRFVMMKSDGDATPTRLNLVVGWFEDLKRRVPSAAR